MVVNALEEAFGKASEETGLDIYSVDPLIGSELLVNAMKAVIIACLLILVYIAFRFEFRSGVVGVLALIHDVLIAVGLFTLMQKEIDATFIAALLTILGYSINGTIVIFDRIRDNMKVTKLKTEEDLEALIDRSIVETLPRTLNTSVTCLFAALALWLLGGEGIRNFSFAFLIGLVAGTYSSIFIASQIWFEWKKRELRKGKLASQNS